MVSSARWHPHPTRLRDEVLALLRAKGAHPMSLRDIQHLLGVPPGGKRDLQALLRRLCESGELVRTRGKRFGVSAEMNLAPGRLQMHPDGYGFVVLDEKAAGDVFVKARELGGAMHGDRVLVRIEREVPGGRGPEGSIVRVLARARASVVGRIERTGEYAYLTPADPRLTQDVFIPDGRVGEARTGQMVVAEITAWPAARRPAEATVVEILGDEGGPGVAEEVIIRQFDLPHRFPRRVLLDAETVPAQVGAAERAGRADLRGLLTVTIDGETARDFDDAISLERRPRGPGCCACTSRTSRTTSPRAGRSTARPSRAAPASTSPAACCRCSPSGSRTASAASTPGSTAWRSRRCSSSRGRAGSSTTISSRP